MRRGPPLHAAIAVLLALLAAHPDAATPAPESQRIEALLRHVEASDVVFLRNGREHDAAEAAAHLRAKWQAAGPRIATARDFVERLASRSSTTGQPYLVRLPDGTERPSAEWLLEALDALETSGAFTPAASPATTPGASGTPPPHPQMPAGIAPQDAADRVLGLLREAPLEFLRVESDEIERYSGRQLARHVWIKYLLDGRPTLAPEAFVDRYATRSALHGTPYLVRFPDGRTAPLRDWLVERLAGRDGNAVPTRVP